MRIAVIDSGLGLVGYADALLQLRGDLELVLAMDPDHMPYGPRPPEQVAELVTQLAMGAMRYDPAAVVVACNTASVHGLDQLRARLEPEVPVIGTVPAVRPAAASGRPVAIWATAATTASDYQRRLIADFAAGVAVTSVACHGLAEAVERADHELVEAAIARASADTPAEVGAVVLGCTHYGLVADQISRTLAPGVQLFDSWFPVARQTLRRVGLAPDEMATGGGVRAVVASGRVSALPASLRAYAVGRRLAQHAAGLVGD